MLCFCVTFSIKRNITASTEPQKYTEGGGGGSGLRGVANVICGKIRRYSAIFGDFGGWRSWDLSLRFPGFSMGRKCPSGFT